MGRGPSVIAQLQRFHEKITADGSYHTDPSGRSLISRLLLGPLWTFYPQVFWIVWTNGRKAKRGAYGDYDWAASSLDILHAIENVGIEIEITGMNNLKETEGPVVFVANHMSTLETFVLPSIIRPVKPVTFVVKESLLTAPVFGPVMRSRDPVVVGRVNPREDLRTVLEGGTKRLADGISIVVFPQSTRSDIFRPHEFNSLGTKLASRAGVPVIPVALKTDAWGTGRLIKEVGPVDRKKKVHFAFGGPIRVEGRGSGEHVRVVRFIREKLEQWGGEVEDGHQDM